MGHPVYLPLFAEETKHQENSVTYAMKDKQ